jgi:hypothetical protein
VNLAETMSNSALAIGQPLPCNVVHSKSLSSVERSVLYNVLLNRTNKGFSSLFCAEARKNRGNYASSGARADCFDVTLTLTAQQDKGNL